MLFLLGLVVTVIMLALLAPLLMQRPDGEAPPCGFRTRVDIATISQAVETYKLDNYRYPSTSQGLQALLKEPTTEPHPINWRYNGYVRFIPLDSWGRELVYESDAEYFEIKSFGEDGKSGGDNCDKDISNQP